MVGLLVTGHAQFATGIGSGLNLITGIAEHICLVDYGEEKNADELYVCINEALDKLKDCDGVLALTDLAGGLPFRTVAKCKAERLEQKIEILAGANLPMLIEAGMMMYAFDCPFELGEIILTAGKEHVVRYDCEVENDEAELSEE